MSKISELSDGGSLVSSDYLIAVRSGGNVKVRMDQINVDQIDLGDNEFIRLGNSQDLTIVHDASNSIINQAGIGDLLIQKAGSTKLTVNSTGVDITGSATMDGLTVDGGSANNDSGAIAGKFNANGNEHIRLEISTDSTIGNQAALDLVSNSNTSRIYTTGSTGLKFSTDGGTTAHAVIDGSGNVSIGTTTVNSKFNVASSQDSLKYNEGVTVFRSTGSNKMFLNCVGGGANIVGSNSPITFNYHDQTNNNVTEAMRISGGNVGIGTSSPNGNGILTLNTPTDNSPQIVFSENDTGKWLIGHRHDGDYFRFYDLANSAERMRIDASGNVAIGQQSTTGGGVKLDLHNSGSGVGTQIGFYNDHNTGGHFIGPAGNTTGNIIYYNTANTNQEFYNNNSLKMTLDSSGNLIISGTSAGDATSVALHNGGYVHAVTSHQMAGIFDRRDSDGDILVFRKDGSGTAVGSIGTNLSAMYIGTGDVGLFTQSAYDRILPYDPSTNAGRDDAIDLGASTARFDDIYATNGTIQTSDRNEKQDIEALSDAEQRVAVAAKGLLRKFRWKSSVAEKGDEARTHFGIIAQDLQAAFAAEGLDAGDYAMFINSTWTDEETGEERSRMGVRYSELLAFIIAAI